MRRLIHIIRTARKSLFSESKRYDVKGKSYFGSPNKYYCEDIGLRNARIGFSQQEMTHIMENIIYNELNIQQFSVVYARILSEREKSLSTDGGFPFSGSIQEVIKFRE